MAAYLHNNQDLNYLILLFDVIACLLCNELNTIRTSRVPAEEKFSDLIINEDEETVGESTEPPGRPVDKRREKRGLNIIIRVIRSQRDDNDPFKFVYLRCGVGAHFRGYILSATSMPGQ